MKKSQEEVVRLSLTEDPIPLLIRRIAGPASVGFFFNTMFNFVDTYCAGLISTDALAALSLSFPVYFLVMAAGAGLGQGSTALIAGAIGAGKPDEARHIFAQALLLCFGISVVLTIAGLLAAPWLFQLLGAEGEYLKTALAFMNVILGGSVFLLLQMTLNTALSAEGETRWYRNFLIAGFIANCVLNPVLMWGWFGLPAMGVAGLALATVIAQVGGCLYLIRGVRSRELFRHMPRSAFHFDGPLMRRIAGQAIPAALNMLTVALGIFVITWFVKHFGKEAVAAVGMATRIEQIALMPSIGLGSAVISLVGQNFGAKRPHRVRETWLTSVRYGAVMMLVGGVLVFFLRDWAMRRLTTDEAVIQHGSGYLMVSAATLAAYPILFSTVFLFQGLKRPGYGLWVGLYRQIVAPFSVYYLFAFAIGWGLWGVWWGICLVNWSAALFALWWGNRATRALLQPADS